MVEEWHDFGREVRCFEISSGGELYLSFNDQVEAYRLEGGKLGRALGHESTLSALEQMEGDASGAVWGWSPLTPLHELRLNEAGRLQLIRHEVVAGRDLFMTGHSLSVTQSGPVMVFEDGLAWRDGETGGWKQADLSGVPGLPLAQDFRVAGDELDGWLVYWDPDLQANRVMQLYWRGDGEVELTDLPWVDMRSLGAIHKMKLIDGEEPLLLIAGVRGLLVAQLDLPDYLPEPAMPVLWDAMLEKTLAREREFPYGTSGIRFKFSSPLTSGLYPVRYQTRLRGLESKWGAAENLPFREIGQVFDGNYTFEVRALDPFGRSSPVASVGLRILPPWYRTAGAYIAYILAALVLIWIMLRGQAWYFRKRQIALERLVDERTVELKRALDFKSDFVANVSHEIRNPLNGVIGMIRQLKEGELPPRRYLTSLRSAAHYLQSTVEDVVDFSKLERGTIELEEDLFDIDRTARGVVGIYAEQAKEKGLQLTSQIRVEENVGVYCDERKIQQIIGNLSGNAVKFTATGSVHVGVILQAHGEGKGILKIWVEDTGPGIPVDEHARIFDKFYQSRTGGCKPMGTGLGLNLVKQYVERMGGEVELKSEPGSGSTFIVVLPVVVKPYKADEDDRDELSFRLPGLPVLIVEDEEYNRLVMEELLSGIGCRVESAEDGKVGLEMAMAGAYRVIFLDWELPSMNGLEIARQLRASGVIDPDVLIIGLTAHATLEVREKCLAEGMDAFMTKPLNLRQLKQLLCGFAEEFRNEPIVVGKGLLQELSDGKDWQSVKERWKGIFESHVADLAVAMKGDDPEAIRKVAHKLLGHLRMIKAQRFPDYLVDLMTSANAGDMSGIRKEYAGFSADLERFRKELSQL